MNERLTTSHKLISVWGEKNPWHSLQQFNTHDHFGNLISLSGKSHILVNTEYLTCGWFGYP